jgi:hypothetical protein
VKPNPKQEKAPILLTEAETDRVAGGDNGNHWGQKAKDEGVPAWFINSGEGKALGHGK